jgi:hypothetical protein
MRVVDRALFTYGFDVILGETCAVIGHIINGKH